MRFKTRAQAREYKNAHGGEVIDLRPEKPWLVKVECKDVIDELALIVEKQKSFDDATPKDNKVYYSLNLLDKFALQVDLLSQRLCGSAFVGGMLFVSLIHAAMTAMTVFFH